MDFLRQIAEGIFSRFQFEYALILASAIILALIIYTIWFSLLRVTHIRPVPPRQLWQDFKMGWRGRARWNRTLSKNGFSQWQLTLNRAKFWARAGWDRLSTLSKLTLGSIYWAIFPRPIEYFVLLLIGLCFTALFYLHFFGTRPYIVAQFPAAGEPWQNMHEPLTLIFDKPIRKENLVLNMSPEIPGKIEFIPSFSAFPDLGLYRKVVFYPEETIAPGQQLIVYAVGVENISGQGEVHETNIDFMSGVLPEIESITLPDNAVDVPTKPQILITLSDEDADFLDWQIKLDPPAEINFSKQTNRSWLLDFPSPLKQTTKYKLEIRRQVVTRNLLTNEITDAETAETVKTLNFSTLKAPLTKEIHPQGDSVLVTFPVTIIFDIAMNTQSVEERFSIEPEVLGQLTWNEEGDRLVFDPDVDLQKDTVYKIQVAEGALSFKGGVLEQPITHEFRTIGPVRFAGFSPNNGAGGVEVRSHVTVTFNQEVDQASAASKFSISPNVAGSIRWEGNTLRFVPSGNMAYGTRYTIRVAAGVGSVHGMPSNEELSFSFTTASEQFLLGGVPQYYQAESFTCNVAAMRMALAYRGVYLSEAQIKAGLGVGVPLSGSSGGDPYKTWIDGHGVYWARSSAFLSGYRSNAIRQNWNIAGMLQEVRNGNPVIIWWQNGWSTWQWKSWTASPGGYQVTGLNGMHSEVVIGYRGPLSDPHTIITRDPWRGTRYYSRSAFDSLWANSFGRAAIVLY